MEIAFSDIIVSNKNFEKFTAAIGSNFLRFRQDECGIVAHAHPNGQWQKPGGYNDFYDYIFEKATNNNMKREIFDFAYNNEKYRIWTWRGDYMNLGSGAEIGIYNQLSIDLPFTDNNFDTKHWMSSSFNLPMTLNLYSYHNRDNIKPIFNWAPYEPQWWITGFNPEFNEPVATKMISIGTIDFYGREEMFESLKEKTRDLQIKEAYKKEYLIFDEDGHTVWLIWYSNEVKA
jgi:hypothetical protein